MYLALNPSKQLNEVNDVVDTASASIGAGSLTTSTTTVNNSYAKTRVEGLAADDFPASKEIAGGKLFAFPCYLVFALMGPIVEAFDMLRHC
jgi:hypothetical protein